MTDAFNDPTEGFSYPGGTPDNSPVNDNQGSFLDALASFFGGGGGNADGQGQGSTSQDEATDGDADVGLINSILMGIGLKDRTDDYYRATLDTINRNDGAAAAERYRDYITGKGVLSVPGALSNYDIATMSITGQPSIPQAPMIATPQIATPQIVNPYSVGGGFNVTAPPLMPNPHAIGGGFKVTAPPQGVASLMTPGAINPLVQ